MWCRAPAAPGSMSAGVALPWACGEQAFPPARPAFFEVSRLWLSQAAKRCGAGRDLSVAWALWRRAIPRAKPRGCAPDSRSSAEPLTLKHCAFDVTPTAWLPGRLVARRSPAIPRRLCSGAASTPRFAADSDGADGMQRHSTPGKRCILCPKISVAFGTVSCGVATCANAAP